MTERKPDKEWSSGQWSFKLWQPGFSSAANPSPECTVRILCDGEPFRLVTGTSDFCRAAVRRCLDSALDSTPPKSRSTRSSPKE